MTGTGQIRGSSRSVCTHIGEAWALKHCPKHFGSESAETRVHLDFALEFGFIDEETHRSLDDKCDHVSAMFFRMTENAESWCS
ncbi:MAG: four helix bundle protein [Planctomycetota bacterium]